MNCVALCACLIDTHGQDVAGYILAELWQACSYPPEYEPSHEQFVNLVKTCEGAFAATTFGETVERFTGPNRLSAMYNREDNIQSRNWERCAKAKDVAKVLCALFDMSQGKIHSITVSGQAECSFIGGLAEWLFDLGVEVDGSYSLPAGQVPRVRLRYSIDNHLTDANAVAKIESTSYYLENTDDFWSQLYSSSPSSSLLILRVPWTSCLSRSFGTYFEQLFILTYTLGEYLGSVARIYSALALGEPGIGAFEDCREGFRDFLDSSHGSGLTQAFLYTFPELQRMTDLASLMQIAESRSFSEAVMSFSNSYASFEKQCKCSSCDENYQNAFGSAKTCIPAIAYTILHCTRFLGSVERDPAMLPTISGIRSRHESAPRLRRNITQNGLKDLLCLRNVSSDRHLTDPILLFSGTPSVHHGRHQVTDDLYHTDLTAISWGGICTYIDSLRQPSGQLEYMRIVHVLPGHIQRNKRKYNAVYDRPLPNDHSSPALNYFEYNKRLTYPTLSNGEADKQAVVTERYQEINFTYGLVARAARSNGIIVPSPFWIQPGFITRTALDRACLVPCSRSSKCLPAPAIECRATPEHLVTPDESMELPEKVACCVSERALVGLDQCLRLQLHQISRHGPSTLYLRRQECIPCCVDAALKASEEILQRATLKFEAPESIKAIFHILNT